MVLSDIGSMSKADEILDIVKGQVKLSPTAEGKLVEELRRLPTAQSKANESVSRVLAFLNRVWVRFAPVALSLLVFVVLIYLTVHYFSVNDAVLGGWLLTGTAVYSLALGAIVGWRARGL